MPSLKEFIGGLPATTLLAGITSASSSFSAASTGGTNYPSGGALGNFCIVIDRGNPSEETILCSSRSGDAFTVDTRGYDGSTAILHDAGAVIEHVLDAVSLQEASTHINAADGADLWVTNRKLDASTKAQVALADTNSGLITTNIAAIATNVTDIGTNVTDIATNTSDIAAINIGAYTIVVAASDEVTAIEAATTAMQFRMPLAMTGTAIRASLGSACSTGTFTVDVNIGGATVLSTKVTIDATEKTSTTAAVPSVLSDTAWADDEIVTIDVDVDGDATATGLKVTLIGTAT